MSKRPKGYYRKKLKELRQERGNKCELNYEGCWITVGLEFMHIKPTDLIGRGRGQPQRYHDIKNHPDAYVLACRRCHADVDALAENFHNYEVDGVEEEVPF